MTGALLRQAWRWLDGMLAPSLCPRCGRHVLPAAGRLCEACAAAVTRLPEHDRCRACGGALATVASQVCRRCADRPPPWFRGVSALDYHGVAGELVRAFKFGRQTALAEFFAGEMAAAWQRYGTPSRPELLVPVPIHPLRRIRRGFNQSELLCRRLSGRLNLPVCLALRRRRPTGHQARLDGPARLKNMRHAIAVGRPAAVAGRSILLVDDVMTTGATLSACAEALYAAGASEVSVLTAARA